MSSRNRRCLLLFFFITLSPLLSAAPSSGAGAWQTIGDGLFLGAFPPPMKSGIYEAKIIILKADLRSHALKLLCASEHGRKPRTARQWCEEFGLLSAINAGMYQSDDSLKSTGFMRNHEHLNNSRMNREFGSILVFDPVDPALPPAQMIDRRTQGNREDLMGKYHCAVQNYRLISGGEKKGWPQNTIIHSNAAVGLDRSGHVLFILSLSPASTHDFIMQLLSLSIGIESAMYVEGGLEASLHVRMKDPAAFKEGRTEMDIINHSPVRIPNVLGIARR